MDERLRVVGLSVWLAATVGTVLAGCSVSDPSGVRFPHVSYFEGCLDLSQHSSVGGGSRGLACVVYDYDGGSLLHLTHTNTLFNCGATAVGGHVSVVPGQEIRIVEDEYVPVPMDCLCLFNVDYGIAHVPPGRYRVYISEMYAGQGNVPFDFELDITAPASGETCLVRVGPGWEWDGGRREPN